MSTILKALEKAQRERASQQEANPASILDVPLQLPESQQVVVRRRSRVGLVIASIIASTLVTLALLGGVLWFLQARLQEWVGRSVTPPLLTNAQALPSTAPTQAEGAFSPAGAPNAPVPVTPPSNATTLNASSAVGADLPPPVPMSELYRETHSAAPATAAAPLAPLASKAPSQTDSQGGFVLGPILYDPRSPMAIVNGMSVREGGVYENFRVLKITPDSVTVQRAGEQPITLRKNRGL